jgi:DNA-binding response OmpR family regulator
VGKALIITFKDQEETTFNELVHFLRRKNSINLMDAFSVESIQEYDGLVIDLRYRTVKVKGKSIELTNYEYEILQQIPYIF